jgi:LAO/AO transport system kinase
VSGGSILGDKTRMSELGRSPSAYIRPTPAAGTLGGVARRTREAIRLCEAAGFDVIIVETVGVGQSEVAVSELVDVFLLVASPAGGDELQGIKRGIMELADVIAVNKADGDLLDAAGRAAGELRHAAHLLRPKHPGWQVPVLTCSALTGEGIEALWSSCREALDHLGADAIAARRAQQDVAWMWSEVSDTLVERLRSHPGVRALVPQLEAAVASGEVSPATAAHRLLATFLEGG